MRPAVLLLTAVLAGFQSAGYGQTVPRRLLVNATYQRGGAVQDLRAAEFVVRESDRTCAVSRVAAMRRPVRVVLLVDASVSAQRAASQIHEALLAFFDALDPPHEAALITTGETLLVRTGPTTDREKLRAASALLFTGANVLLGALPEGYDRFLRSGEHYPILLVLTVSGPGSRTWPGNQTLARLGRTIQANGGTVYGTVLLLPEVFASGLTTEGGAVRESDSADICATLATAAGGFCWDVPTPAGLPAALDALAIHVNESYRRSPLSYEIEYDGVGNAARPSVRVTRPGVRIEVLSPR
jgi:hypothetical protein